MQNLAIKITSENSGLLAEALERSFGSSKYNKHYLLAEEGNYFCFPNYNAKTNDFFKEGNHLTSDSDRTGYIYIDNINLFISNFSNREVEPLITF